MRVYTQASSKVFVESMCGAARKALEDKLCASGDRSSDAMLLLSTTSEINMVKAHRMLDQWYIQGRRDGDREQGKKSCSER